MRQSIEKQRETMSNQKIVTVMFHDRKAFSAVTHSFRARGNAAPSLSDPLAVTGPVVSPVPSLPPNMKVSDSRAQSRHRTRLRASQDVERFAAEVPHARSAWFVFGSNSSSHGQVTAATSATTVSEHRRWAGADQVSHLGSALARAFQQVNPTRHRARRRLQVRNFHEAVASAAFPGRKYNNSRPLVGLNKEKIA